MFCTAGHNKQHGGRHNSKKREGWTERLRQSKQGEEEREIQSLQAHLFSAKCLNLCLILVLFGLKMVLYLLETKSWERNVQSPESVAVWMINKLLYSSSPLTSSLSSSWLKTCDKILSLLSALHIEFSGRHPILFSGMKVSLPDYFNFEYSQGLGAACIEFLKIQRYFSNLFSYQLCQLPFLFIWARQLL